ncbi:uncharacterized protein DS421_19g658760 [Arachis hypogaea]|uniref:Uncharacterized protein n=1 Tax=Arachis hypogaea TaxID=3818 RepID=A0A6B9V9S8_ARAHY|nr:uncharacterized protein DS421_19g658760 [Arachis hypogaea]
MSDKMISKVENDNVQKQVDVNSMSKKIKILRIWLLKISKTPDIIRENMPCNGSEKMVLENSVLVTFLRQLKSKAENLVTERDALEELRTQSKEFLAQQTDVKITMFKIWSLGAACCVAIFARVIIVSSGLLLTRLLFSGAHPFLWCKGEELPPDIAAGMNFVEGPSEKQNPRIGVILV